MVLGRHVRYFTIFHALGMVLGDRGHSESVIVLTLCSLQVSGEEGIKPGITT